MPTPEDIRAQYGFVAMLARQVPEIAALMERAVNEQWTSDRFSMSVADTGWWKSTDAATRQWITQTVADPASARSQMDTGGQTIANQAERLGLSRPADAQAQQLWLHSKLHGLDEKNTNAFIFQQLRHNVDDIQNIGGDYGQLINNMHVLASKYGYAPPDLEHEIRTVAGDRFAAGSGADEFTYWRSKLANYASSKYAPFADRIQAGESVQDIAKPYIDVYAQTLEVNPGSVKLDDKYIQQWLQGRSEAGKPPVAAPVWQAAAELRKDPRWQYTRNAWESTANLANVLGRSFGMRG